jgi:hypothetical protein
MDVAHPPEHVLDGERVVVLHEPFEHLFSPWMADRSSPCTATPEPTQAGRGQHGDHDIVGLG